MVTSTADHCDVDIDLDEETLCRVVADVNDAEIEHGLTACFSIAEHVLSRNPGRLATHLHRMTMPRPQWSRICDAIHDRATAVDPRGSEEVLQDWAAFGPQPTAI